LILGLVIRGFPGLERHCRVLISQLRREQLTQNAPWSRQKSSFPEKRPAEFSRVPFRGIQSAMSAKAGHPKALDIAEVGIAQSLDGQPGVEVLGA